MQQLESLRSQLDCQNRGASGVSARAIEARNKAVTDGVDEVAMRGGRTLQHGYSADRQRPGEARPQTEVARLKRAFYRFQRALTERKLVAKINDCFFIGVHSLP
jgi:hypothetical protein